MSNIVSINQARILAIETATSSCSVAIEENGVVFELSETGNNIHSQVLLGMVQQVLKDAKVSVSDLNAVAVGQGPGSFTGLRIGIGVAQGLAYGAECQMIGISSLAALAHQSQETGYILAGIDARMSEIYWGLYKNRIGDEANEITSQTELIGQLSVSAPKGINIESISDQSIDFERERLFLVGNAWSEYRDVIDKELFERATELGGSFMPIASGVLALAKHAYAQEQLISPIDFAPHYIRNNVASK